MRRMRANAIGLDVVGSSGGEELVICPFHDDHNASATWNPKSDLFYCFTCGIGMNLEQLLKRTGQEIDAELVYEDRIVIPDLEVRREELDIHVGTHAYPKYLQERGISAEAMEAYGVTWGDEESGGSRIIFPSQNLFGKTMGIMCRYIHPGTGPRYRKTGQMYPIWPMEHLVGSAYGEYVIVTEGLFSCLRIASVSSVFKVVSIAGAKANSEIVAALAAFNPIFIYDRDNAGVKAATRMKQLRPDWTVLTSKPAPDDMLEDSQIKKLVAKLADRIK
jgi:DNA primase